MRIPSWVGTIDQFFTPPGGTQWCHELEHAKGQVAAEWLG